MESPPSQYRRKGSSVASDSPMRHQHCMCSFVNTIRWSSDRLLKPHSGPEGHFDSELERGTIFGSEVEIRIRATNSGSAPVRTLAEDDWWGGISENQQNYNAQRPLFMQCSSRLLSKTNESLAGVFAKVFLHLDVAAFKGLSTCQMYA